jgi:hypothetical protein
MAAEYLPSNVSIKDPQNMQKADIDAFLLNVYKRQEESGPAASFRFHSWLDSDKNRKAAVYDDNHDKRLVPERRSRKKKANGKQKADEPQADDPPERSGEGSESGAGGAAASGSGSTSVLELHQDKEAGADGAATSGSSATSILPEELHQDKEAGANGAAVSGSNATSVLPEPVSWITQGTKGKQRKVLNSDALAIQEAEKMMRTDKRNPRLRVRMS